MINLGKTSEIRPLGMINRNFGGTDFGTPPSGQYGVVSGYGPNNVGLLIVVWGKVTRVSDGCIFLDDGSGQHVCIDAGTLVSPPAIGDYVRVTGISSLCTNGGLRYPSVLPRDDEDVRNEGPSL